VKIESFGGSADDDAVALDDSKDREDLLSSLLTPRTVADRMPARCTAALSVTTVWLGRSDCSRRDTRQRANGSGAIRSAVAVIRQ